MPSWEGQLAHNRLSEVRLFADLILQNHGESADPTFALWLV